MPLKPYLSICLFFILNSAAFCQQVQETNAPVFFEKAYLHTDRDVYGQGEDIWFKAYVVNAQDNSVINYSHNLYVELISPAAKVVSQEMLRLEKGLGNGDFKLSDSIPAGHYRLRAYTNWMRNFGDHFIFEKNISILQTADVAANANVVTAKAQKKDKEKSKTASASATTTIDPAASTLPVVRFFPEGGDLVNGLSAIIGVKAEDAAGRGIAASGKIVGNDGQGIAAFSCDSLGFGVIALLPAFGQHYQALVMLQGVEQRFVLPDIKENGFSMQVRYLGADTVKVIISTAAGVGKHLYLVARHSGKTYVRQTVVLKRNQGMMPVPNDRLPEGITAITLYDELSNPLSERLVYIHHVGSVTPVSITTNQPSALPKGLMRVKISTAPGSHLSLAAVDADAVPVQPENILSYLNLQSEIKGNIEQSDRYFDTTNVNRFKQLDLLLLTQGWRDFVWKKIADTALKIAYQPEQGITLTGRVRRVGVNKPLPGIDVTMRAPKAEGQKLFWATTDSAGRFAIYDTKFYGYQYLSFTSRKGDKINRDGESKGVSGGYIQVDSLLRDTPPIRPLAEASPADTSWKTRQQQDAEIERIRKALNLKAGHNLKEVIIKAHTSRLYTELPPEIHPITLVEQKEYDNLAQYLAYTIEEARLTWDSTGNRHLVIVRNGALALIPLHATYTDSSKVGRYSDEELLNHPMSDALKVTINRFEDVFGKNISVRVLLRPGAMDTKDYFDNTTADITGYYKARVFYKPSMEKPDAIDQRTNTIHWEPNITTDYNGEATVNFYNTAQTGKVRLIAEGVTSTGTPLAATTDYEVK